MSGVIQRGALRVWEGGAGAPLLYLHGFEHHPGDASFLRGLATSRAVRAPECPGYGQSTGFERWRDITDMVLSWRRFIEDWGVGPVDLIGHSLGGMFAAEIAALCPHLVRRLVLVDAYGLWDDNHPMPDPFVMPPAALAAAKWADPAWAAREPNIFDGTPAEAAIARTGNLAVATKFMWPIAERGLIRRLPFIHAPTLIVHGARDGLVPPAYATAFAAAIPNAQVTEIAAAGHLPMVEAEGIFLEAVTAFLS